MVSPTMPSSSTWNWSSPELENSDPLRVGERGHQSVVTLVDSGRHLVNLGRKVCARVLVHGLEVLMKLMQLEHVGMDAFEALLELCSTVCIQDQPVGQVGWLPFGRRRDQRLGIQRDRLVDRVGAGRGEAHRDKWQSESGDESVHDEAPLGVRL